MAKNTKMTRGYQTIRKWRVASVDVPTLLPLVSLVVVGCGIPQEDYDAMVAQRIAAPPEHYYAPRDQRFHDITLLNDLCTGY